MISVAIDGPAGAGKSTIARTAAMELDFIYVDTGALYRAVGLACIERGIQTEETAEVINVLDEISIELVFVKGEQRVLLDGKDVSDEIRTEKASMTASLVSRIPQVRSFLLELQRSFSKTNNVIMDGRDIGTVVLPDAQVKIFLTASPEARAKRRTLQLQEKGEKPDYNTILEDIKKRDYNDSHREIAPLKPAKDSVIIDTTQMSLQQSIEAVKDTIKRGIK